MHLVRVLKASTTCHTGMVHSILVLDQELMEGQFRCAQHCETKFIIIMIVITIILLSL